MDRDTGWETVAKNVRKGWENVCDKALGASQSY